MTLTVDKFEAWKGCGGRRHRLLFSVLLGGPRRRQHRLVEQLLGQGGVFHGHGFWMVLAGRVKPDVRPLSFSHLSKVPLLVEEPQQESQMFDGRG